MVVDGHAHVFLKDMPLAGTRRYAPSHDATPADYLGLLDAHRVTHGVLVQPSFLGTGNDYLLAALRAHPQRLRGVVMLDPQTDEVELAALNTAGVVGVRLNLVGQPLPDLDAPQWQGFLARLKALDWHLELHRQAADLPPLPAQAQGMMTKPLPCSNLWACKPLCLRDDHTPNLCSAKSCCLGQQFLLRLFVFA